MKTDRSFCHTCKQVTSWVQLKRGSTRLKCSVCSDIFPCRHTCQHLDCADARKETPDVRDTA